MLGYFHSDIVGLEGASGRLHLCSWPLRRHQQLLPPQQGRMVPALPTSIPRLLPLRVPKLAPARAPCH